MTVDEKIGAMSVDAQWVADKSSEYGFTREHLESLYPAAERVALDWAARGDTRIGIDLVTGEMKRRFKLSFSNTVRPFLARLLRDRLPQLRPLIKVSTTSRGGNRNLKVLLDYLDVVGVVVRTPEGERTCSIEEAMALAEQRRSAATPRRRKPVALDDARATADLDG